MAVRASGLQVPACQPLEGTAVARAEVSWLPCNLDPAREARSQDLCMGRIDAVGSAGDQLGSRFDEPLRV